MKIVLDIFGSETKATVYESGTPKGNNNIPGFVGLIVSSTVLALALIAILYYASLKIFD